MMVRRDREANSARRQMNSILINWAWMLEDPYAKNKHQTTAYKIEALFETIRDVKVYSSFALEGLDKLQKLPFTLNNEHNRSLLNQFYQDRLRALYT